MAYFLETVSHNTTGVKTRTVGFQALGYRITVGPKNGGTAFVSTSTGLCDGTNQVCDSAYSDPSRADAPARYNDRVVFIREWNGSAYVTKVQAAHDSITATEIKYNVTTADVNYQFLIEAWG